MFIRTAAMDGMTEVEHGRVAAQQGTHDEVKQFGQRMVDDHSNAGDELKGLASQKNVMLPAGLDAKHQAMPDKLSKLKGAASTGPYGAHGHRAPAGGGVVSEGSEPWPGTLQEHLKVARGINAKVTGAPKTEGAGPK